MAVSPSAAPHGASAGAFRPGSGTILPHMLKGALQALVAAARRVEVRTWRCCAADVLEGAGIALAAAPGQLEVLAHSPGEGLTLSWMWESEGWQVSCCMRRVHAGAAFKGPIGSWNCVLLSAIGEIIQVKRCKVIITKVQLLNLDCVIVVLSTCKKL